MSKDPFSIDLFSLVFQRMKGRIIVSQLVTYYKGYLGVLLVSFFLVDVCYKLSLDLALSN